MIETYILSNVMFFMKTSLTMIEVNTDSVLTQVVSFM